MKIKIAVLLTMATAFVATAGARPYTIKFDSQPEGAHVFMVAGAQGASDARDYVGVTPCEITVKGTRSGYFITPKPPFVGSFVSGTVKFTAEPPGGSTNLFSQSESFRTPARFKGGNKIPHAIFFDLTRKN
jgi:hypothetical protein